MSVLAQMKRQLGSSSSSKNIKVLDLDVISGQPMKQIATSTIKTKRAKHMEVINRNFINHCKVVKKFTYQYIATCINKASRQPQKDTKDQQGGQNIFCSFDVSTLLIIIFDIRAKMSKYKHSKNPMYMDELEKIENDLKEAKVTFLASLNLSN